MKKSERQKRINHYAVMLANGTLKLKQHEMMEWFANYGHTRKEWTRAEIEDHAAMPMRTGSVCGRINELLEIGLIVYSYCRQCSVTKSNGVTTLVLAKC